MTTTAANLGPVEQKQGNHILRRLIAHPGVGRLAWEKGPQGGVLCWEQEGGRGPLWKGLPKARAPPAVIKAPQTEAAGDAAEEAAPAEQKLVGDEKQMLAEPSFMAAGFAAAAAQKAQKQASNKAKQREAKRQRFARKAAVRCWGDAVRCRALLGTPVRCCSRLVAAGSSGQLGTRGV